MIVHFLHILGVRTGSRDDVTEALHKGPITLGRDRTDCAVWFHDEDLGVSRRHARVGRDAEGLWAEDLGSPNGTTLNGEPLLARTPLAPGAVLRLGRHAAVSLVVLAPPPQPPRPRRRRALLLGGGFLLLCALLSLSVFAWSARTRLARSRQALEDLTALLDAAAEKGEAQPGLDPDPVDPRVVAAIQRTRAAADAAPTPDPSEDPLAAHLQRVLADLSGGTVTTVNRLLRDEVARELPLLIRQTRERANGRNGAWCRAPVLRPKLEAALKDAMAPNEARAHWISYIPWIESEYWPDPPLGGAGERGVWQFIPKTGERYGLLDGGVDRRCQVQSATEAAARLFNDNFQACTAQFPLLAVAAFNTGAHNACRLAHDPTIPLAERDVLGFIARGKLHEVTHDYVPRWLAATFLGDRPQDALLVALDYDPNVGGLPECDAADARIPADGPC